MTPEEIAEAVAAGMRIALAEMRIELTARTLPPKRLFTATEAHEITGLPVSWFEDEAAAQRIPSRKIGRYRRYSLSDLESIIEVCEVQPTSGPLLKAFRAWRQRR